MHKSIGFEASKAFLTASVVEWLACSPSSVDRIDRIKPKTMQSQLECFASPQNLI
jgi:hypothetical protein